MPPDIIFQKNTSITTSQDLFLANSRNKVRFLELLSEYLKNQKINVETATDDADALIVRRTLEVRLQSKNVPVVVVGEDVDLLVLIIGLTSQNDEILFYKPGKSATVGRI